MQHFIKNRPLLMNIFYCFAIIFGQRTFFSITKLVFQEKCEFYLFYYLNTISKDWILFKYTWLRIQIGIIAMKKHVFLNVLEKYVRLKWKKASQYYYNYPVLYLECFWRTVIYSYSVLQWKWRAITMVGGIVNEILRT